MRMLLTYRTARNKTKNKNVLTWNKNKEEMNMYFV